MMRADGLQLNKRPTRRLGAQPCGYCWPTMKGRKTLCSSDPTEPAQHLAAAILALAIADARAGDAEAAQWLAEDAPALAELLGVDPVTLACWPDYAGGGYSHRAPNRHPAQRIADDERRARDRRHKQTQRERKRQAKGGGHGNDNSTDTL